MSRHLLNPLGVAPSWRLGSVVAPDVDLPTLASVDVLVVGAGAAGVAAATTAAERGKTVMLIERYGFSGGAAVAGMSGTICGMYYASDRPERPEQVVYGFTERFRSALADRGGLTAPQLYGKTFTSAHDPHMWVETADDLLESAGVEILFHTTVTDVIMDGPTYRGVVVTSNAGSSAIFAERLIDASGDAALVARAGGAHRFGDEGRIQNPTMFLRLGNVDVERFEDFYGTDTICPPRVSEMIHDAQYAGFDLPRTKIWVFTTPRPNELMVNATRVSHRDGRELNVIDPADFTEGEIAGRIQAREYADFFRARIPGCEGAFLEDTGVEVGVRQTRSIVGRDVLNNEDVVAARKRGDGICRVPWPIELHDSRGSNLHWLLDDYYDVPYGSLLPESGSNIIVAGRCLSAQHEALASARVTAQCFEYGHAAGAAAALSLDRRRQLAEIDVDVLRERMVAAGSRL
jgi:hypothetical protein